MTFIFRKGVNTPLKGVWLRGLKGCNHCIFLRYSTPWGVLPKLFFHKNKIMSLLCILKIECVQTLLRVLETVLVPFEVFKDRTNPHHQTDFFSGEEIDFFSSSILCPPAANPHLGIYPFFSSPSTYFMTIPADIRFQRENSPVKILRRLTFSLESDRKIIYRIKTKRFCSMNTTKTYRTMVTLKGE